MIRIPRIKGNTDKVEELRREMNLILAQIEEQVNRDLNNIEDELSQKGQK